MQPEEKGEAARVYRVEQMYFIRCDIKTPLDKGHVPIWRHIIASSYIQLDRLYRAVVGPKSQIIG